MLDNKNVIRVYIQKHIPHIIFILVISVFLGFFRMYSTVYIEYLTDAIEMKKAELLTGMVLITCILQAMFYFLRWVVAITAGKFNEEVAFHYRVRVMHHIKLMSFADYEKLGNGKVQSIIRTDSQRAATYMYILFSRILPNVFILIFSYGYMFSIDIIGTVIMAVISVSLGIVNYYINKKIKDYSFKERELSGIINDIVIKICEIFDSIKTYQCSDYVIKQYNKHRDAFNKATLDTEKVYVKNDMVLSFVSNATLFTAAILLSFKAIDGSSSIGEVLAYIVTLTQVTICVTTILAWMSSLAGSKASIKRIDEVLNIDVAGESNTVNLKQVDTVIFNNLNYSYDNKDPIINGLSLNLQKGNVYQIIGESGSGKTTLIKLLMGLYRCDEANILVNGSEIQSIQKLIGYVPSNPNLFNASIFDNIAMGSDITSQMCYDIAKEIGIYEWLSSLPDGLNHIINRNASNVSGGQKQALAILRVLVLNYPIIIMDEPFSALDKQREENLISIINKIKNDRIIIFTSHRNCLEDERIFNIQL